MVDCYIIKSLNLKYKVMYKAEEIKSENGKCNAHVANQFRVTNYSFNKNGQDKTWPLECKQVDANKEIFPESWSGLPVSGLFIQRRAS